MGCDPLDEGGREVRDEGPGGELVAVPQGSREERDRHRGHGPDAEVSSARGLLGCPLRALRLGDEETGVHEDCGTRRT